MQRKFLALSTLLVLSTMGLEVYAQRSGQNARVTIGVIEAAQAIELSSNTGGGAAVGGLAGWASASGKSSSKQARNALIGAGLGGLVANKSQGSRNGMQYRVRTGEGAFIEVVSDQTQMQIGDCVTVEEQGDKANVRRISAAMCDEKNAEVQAVPEVKQELEEDAAQCAAAKDRILEAKTPEETETALQVAKFLCND